MTELKAVTVYKCDCGELSYDEGGPVYECGSCGTRFNRDNSADGGSHRCPDCNKFANKVAEVSCVICGEDEVQEVEAYECPDCNALYEDKAKAKGCCEKAT